MLDVVIPRTSAPPIGQAQLLPAVGGVNRAAKPFRIHKALHHQDRVSILLLPVRAESLQSGLEHPRAQIGHRPIWNQQVTGVIDHQRQAPPPLLVGPTDPFVAIPQVLGSGAEDQHAHPPSPLIRRNIDQPLAHRTQAPQIVMPPEQRLDARHLPQISQADMNLIQYLLRLGGRTDFGSRHAASLKSSGTPVQPSITTHSTLAP
jgi:hypothetical protein